MTDNGRHDPVVDLMIVASDQDDVRPLDPSYDALLEMARLEELLEAMGELGASDRPTIESLPVSPASVEVMAEMDALGMNSTDQIEARLAELAAILDDE